MAVTIVLIAPTTVAMTTSTGPTTAAIPAILMIICCWSSLSPSHFSFRVVMASRMAVMASTIMGAAVSTMSEPSSFIMFMLVCIWSIGSRVSSNVEPTLPAKSCIDVPSSSKERRPSMQASAIAGPAFAPNSSVAAA